MVPVGVGVSIWIGPVGIMLGALLARSFGAFAGFGGSTVVFLGGSFTGESLDIYSVNLSISFVMFSAVSAKLMPPRRSMHSCQLMAVK